MKDGMDMFQKGDDTMKSVRDYQETMQKLYEAAMKYPDEKLAKAIGDVRDLVVEYKNIIDGYEGRMVCIKS